MPPSPAMRCSPGRELRADNHKRGRSLENGIRLKQRDDDLALFNEVQSREKYNFLLQGNDDFEDIFASKLRNFSDFKLGINIPARGESSDLLHAEEEKNDYEWLITPPDTPLFASLDDEVPQVNHAQRGRFRTQPISISRSSTMEKSHRSSKGSASPNRISLSPRSHNNTFENRYRAMSAPSASPPTSKPTATSLKSSSSPPSCKPSTPPRRSSTGSNTTTTARGSSGISPKVKAWQSTIPGFSTEVPPNLRTSLADRPASYIRGSSPASRSSRQSMSPTASRSISSSKGSVGSSADDDVEYFSSVVGNNKQRVNSRRVSGFQNNNKGLVSRKPSRTVSSSSAPKRSFDLALRQMDHKKGPQNMFRPLLSSVPSSMFHAPISSSPHHTMNSSVTTSSNASSGLGNTGPHDPEMSQDDAISGFSKNQDDEVFVIEKDESFDDSRNITDLGPTTLTASLTFDNISEINSQTGTGLLICSKCGSEYSLENENNVCGDCIDSNSPLTIIDPVGPATVDEVRVQSGQNNDIVKDGQSTYKEPIWNFLSETSISQSQSEECETKKVNHDTVDFSKSKVESLEGAGISILLKKSTSLKGAVLRNTSFSASSISYDDFSYVRGSTNSIRSVSATSSVDFGVNKQTDTRFQRQLSSTKSEIENYKNDLIDFRPSSSSGKEGQENHEENDTFTPENQAIVDPEESLLNDCLNVEELQKAEDSESNDTNTDVDKVPLDVISEGEFNQESGRFSTDLKCEVELSSTSSIEELLENEAVFVEDHDTSNHTSNVNEKSIVLVEPEGRLKGRSLTLEEATDTILFCSSIIHNLAQNAATIAIEKENSNSLNNVSWPLISATKKYDLNKPEFQIQTATKPSSKSQKSMQKKVEIDTMKAPNFETEVKIDQPNTKIVGVRNLNNGESKKPPMLESKCNCTIM